MSFSWLMYAASGGLAGVLFVAWKAYRKGQEDGAGKRAGAAFKRGKKRNEIDNRVARMSDHELKRGLRKYTKKPDRN